MDRSRSRFSCLPAFASCLLAGAMFIGCSTAKADTFSTPDGSFTFTYPQKWQANDANGIIRLTAPDNSGYTVKLDTVETALTAASPSNDVGLKAAAAKIAGNISSGATFVRASSVSMDHGQGASFRYKNAAGDPIDVWIGLMGKHSVVMYPFKAGQPGQTIGLSVIFQSLAFTDSLPKQPERQAPKPPMQEPPANPPARLGKKQNGLQNPGSSSGAGFSGPKTVLYSKQIAPVLSQRCEACHSSNSASGGLSVSTYKQFLFGGSRGGTITPGNPDRSSLIDYLTGAKDRMPKGSDPLSPAQIEMFRTWIKEGATNDLDPGSSNGAPSSTGSDGTASGTTPAKRKKAGAAAGAGLNQIASRQTLGPKPMESYAGHLASNDNKFTLMLYTNGTATADWLFDQPSPARFSGTYTIVTGVYTIKMDLASGSIPGGTRSLKLVMQAAGSDVVGKFSLDTSAPRFKIMGLELAEIDNASKNNTTQGVGGTGTGTGAGSGSGTQKRRRAQ